MRQGFEAAAARWQALPKCGWTEVLPIHCNDPSLEILDSLLAHLEVEGEKLLDYKRLRDHMLHTGELQHHPGTYLVQLHTLEQGQYSALDLGLSIQNLKKQSERAKSRQERFNNCDYPTLSTPHGGQVYVAALNSVTPLAITGQLELFDPTLPTYLTKVITVDTLATQAEDRLSRNFLSGSATHATDICLSSSSSPCTRGCATGERL
ncbi:hypothetical protein Efla_003587 [Eimeria flavescens]